MMPLRSQLPPAVLTEVELLGLPLFPEFKPLELRDRYVVEHLTRRLPPYSDFNFVSMWSWDVYNLARLSTLNGNLVVRFTDYISGEPFFSFVGTSKLNETVETLFDFMRHEGIPPRLKLLPESIAQSLRSRGVMYEPDGGNYDYIMAVDRLKDLPGQKFRVKRKEIHQFVRFFAPEFRSVDLSSSLVQDDALDVFVKWATHRGIERPEEENEYRALCRLLFASREFPDLVAHAAYVDNKMVGFIVSEDLRNKYAMGHFCKADLSVHSGIYAYMLQRHADALWKRGCQFLNTEQDLGHEGMRQNKSSYIPLNHLHKYTVWAQDGGTDRITIEPSAAMLMGVESTEGQISFRPAPINTNLWLSSLPPSEDDVLSQPIDVRIDSTWTDSSDPEGESGKP
jgi:hypothetical protein